MTYKDLVEKENSIIFETLDNAVLGNEKEDKDESTIDPNKTFLLNRKFNSKSLN